MACVRASMPLSAVTLAGQLSVSRESATAPRGRRELLRMPTLIFAPPAVGTAAAVDSEPLPALGRPQISRGTGPGRGTTGHRHARRGHRRQFAKADDGAGTEDELPGGVKRPNLAHGPPACSLKSEA